MLKILAHAAVIIGLYLAFSFVLFLGLQVNPLYGNIGLVAVAVLAAFYLYMVFGRRSPCRWHPVWNGELRGGQAVPGDRFDVILWGTVEVTLPAHAEGPIRPLRFSGAL